MSLMVLTDSEDSATEAAALTAQGKSASSKVHVQCQACLSTGRMQDFDTSDSKRSLNVELHMHSVC